MLLLSPTRLLHLVQAREDDEAVPEPQGPALDEAEEERGLGEGLGLENSSKERH